MKASYLLKQNIDALLRARGQTRHDLAMWCRRTDPWLSKILKESAGEGRKERGLPLKYLDRIADFFGLSAFQLFQPGISPLTERRRGERRSGRDRRITAAVRTQAETSGIHPDDLALLRDINGLLVDDRRRVENWVRLQRAHSNELGAGGPPDLGPTRKRTDKRSRRNPPPQVEGT